MICARVLEVEVLEVVPAVLVAQEVGVPAVLAVLAPALALASM